MTVFTVDRRLLWLSLLILVPHSLTRFFSSNCFYCETDRKKDKRESSGAGHSEGCVGVNLSPLSLLLYTFNLEIIIRLIDLV